MTYYAGVARSLKCFSARTRELGGGLRHVMLRHQTIVETPLLYYRGDIIVLYTFLNSFSYYLLIRK